MAKAKAAAKTKGKFATKMKSSPPRTKPKKSTPKKTARPAKKSSPKKMTTKQVAPKKAPPKKAPPKKVAPKKAPPKKPVAKAAKKSVKLAFGSIEQVEHFSAAPELVYRALMDGKLHAAFTGAVAKVNAKVGSAFHAWGGYIKGRVLHLVPGEKIVQAWRTTDFPREYPDSNLEIHLTPESGGTRLRLLHTHLPEQSVESYDSGWQANYWQPLRAWLSTLPQQLELPLTRAMGKKPARTKSAKE